MKQKFTIQSESIFYNNETINILYLENKTTKYRLYQKENENDTYDEALFTKFEFDDSFQIAPKKKFSNITFLFFKDDSTNMFQLKYNNKFLYYQLDTSDNFIYNSTMSVVQADGSLYTKKNTLTKTLNIFDNTPIVKENDVEKLIENELNYLDNSISNEETPVETVVEVVSVEDSVVEDTVVEDTVVETSVVEDSVVEDPVVEDTVVETSVVEDTLVQDSVVETSVVEDTLVQDSVVEDHVVEDTVIEDTVVETSVVEDTVVEDTVVEDTVVEDTVIEDSVVEECVVEKPVEDIPVENLKHKKVTFKETDNNKNSFTFKNIIEDFLILDKAISKSIEEKINLEKEENTINQNKITCTHNNINYNLYSTKLTPIKQNINLMNQVIEKSNIFTNYDKAIELDNKNMNYLIFFNKTKYLVNKKDMNVTFINLQNKNIISINNKEYFKLENVSYLLTNNSTIIIPVENKRIFDNNNGTSYNVLIPKSSI